MIGGKDLAARQEAMKRRGAPRPRPKPRKTKWAPIEQRVAAIMDAFKYTKSGCMSLGDLRALTSHEHFGRGWWADTIQFLCKNRVLQKVDLDRRGIQIGLRPKIQAMYFTTWKPNPK